MPSTAPNPGKVIINKVVKPLPLGNPKVSNTHRHKNANKKLQHMIEDGVGA